MTPQYTFDPLPEPVVGPGEFVFAAVGLDHGHVHGMTEGLIDAGATVSDAILFDQVHVGAGAVVRADVPAGALAVSAGNQRNIEGWVVSRRSGTVQAEAAQGGAVEGDATPDVS